MDKRTGVSIEDVRAAMRVIGECRDVGENPAAWNLRIACYLKSRLRSVLTICFTNEISTDGINTVHDIIYTMWEDNRRHTRWQKLNDNHRYREYPTVQRFGLKCLNQPCTFLRQDLVLDAEWNPSEERAVRRSILQDELIISSQPWRSSISHVFSINRASDDVPFTAADRALVRLVHEELGLLFDTKLMLKADGKTVPAELSPRMQSVLICLLAGEGEKQIAARMGLSGHTVHDHVRALYRKFDVRSRHELFAYAHRRGWLADGRLNECS